MFEFLSGVTALGKLYDRFSQQIEFWKGYSGQRIRIRQHTLDREDERGTGFKQTNFVVEGTVDDVMSFPPGFLLTDVVESVQMSDFSMSFTANSTKMYSTHPGPQGQQETRRIEQKFVAFDAIEELELAESSDDAVEPFRASNEEQTDENKKER